ncbi:MAG: hypothetical protein QHJ82_13645 [Verrucomicrobiota bacterium]|nr:hypothetical protein [Verrucomicrobiota bacterium]
MKGILKSICCFVALAAAAQPATAAETQEPLGWRLGVAAWSFNRFTLFDAIERAAAIGLKYIEAFEGQQLQSGSETKLDVNMPNAAIESAAPPSYPLFVGWATTDITPPAPVALTGHLHNRISTGASFTPTVQR